jgi:O-antigen/teichoic acid export membrane protein
MRGILQGLRELKDNAISILIEYVTMFLFLIVFFYIFGKDVSFAGLSILLAPFFSLLFILYIVPKHKKRFSRKQSVSPETKTLLLFIIPTSFINFSSGFITSLGPLFIKFLGDFALAGIFAASLVIFKAARTVLTSLFISILPHLSRQEALKNYQMLNRIIRTGLIFVSIVFIALIIISLTIGQNIIRIIYGEEFVLDKIHLFLMSLFTGFFLLSELFNRVLLAKSMIKEVTISWFIAFCVLVTLLFIPLKPLFRVEISLLGAGIVAFAGMSLFLLIRKNGIK